MVDFDDLNARPNNKPFFVISIEGVRPRFGHWLPSWNPIGATARTINQLLARPPKIGGQDVDPLNGQVSVPSHSFGLVDIDGQITDLISVSDTPKNKTFLTAALTEDQDYVPVDDYGGFASEVDLFINRETVHVDGKRLRTDSGTADLFTGLTADADPDGASPSRLHDVALSGYADDYFKGALVEFTGGANTGQIRAVIRSVTNAPISGFPWSGDEGNDNLYFDPQDPLPNNVTAGDVYKITQARHRLRDNAIASSMDDYWKGAKLLITADTDNPINIGEIRFVKFFDQTEKTMEFYEPLPAVATAGTSYSIEQKVFINAERGMYGSEAAEQPVTDSNGHAFPVDVVDKPPFMKTRRVEIYENRQGLLESEGKTRHGIIDDYNLEGNGEVYHFKCSGLLRLLARKILHQQAKGKIGRFPVWGGQFEMKIPAYGGEYKRIPWPVMADGEQAEYTVTEIFTDEPSGLGGLLRSAFPAEGANIMINGEVIRYQSVEQFFDNMEGFMLALTLGEHFQFAGKRILEIRNTDVTPDLLALHARGMFADKIGIQRISNEYVNMPSTGLWANTPDAPLVSAFMQEHAIDDEITQVMVCDDSPRSDFPRLDEVIFWNSVGVLPDTPFTITGALGGFTATVTGVELDIDRFTGVNNGILTVKDATGIFVEQQNASFGEQISIGGFTANVDEHRIGDGTDRPARNNPLNVFMQLLMSTGKGTNGKYDTLALGFGIEIDQDLVDITAIEKLRDEIFKTVKIDFVITEATSFKELMEKNLFKFLQLFPLETVDGKISLSYLYTEPEVQALDDDSPLVELDDDELEAVVLPDWNSGQIPVTKVIVKYNKHPIEDEFFSKIEINFPRSRRFYGKYGRTVKIQSAFLYMNKTTWSTLEPADPELPEIVARVLNPMWGRHSSYPAPRIAVRTPYRNMVLNVGQPVKLTHPSLPNLRTSQRGLASEYVQILGLEKDAEQGFAALKVWQIGVHDLKYVFKAPSTDFFSYTADGGGGKAKIDFYRQRFSKTADGLDVSRLKVGDIVQFLTPDYDPIAARVTPEQAEIESITADGVDAYVILTTNLTDPPPQGSLMEIAPHDDATSTRQDTVVFLADEDRLLGSGDDTAFKYK